MESLQAFAQVLAPTGVLRAVINLGNTVLATRDSTGQPSGVSVDLAQELATRLGVPLQTMAVNSAAESVAALGGEQADIGFFAIDPARAQAVTFTHPYLLIEGVYLVREDSPLKANEEVDRPGHRVVVGKGSAYDLFLTRALTNAQLVRVEGSPAVAEYFLREQPHAAAGIRQQIEALARRHPGLRVLPGRFMVIPQAMGLPTARGTEAAEALTRFVENIKAAGWVAPALQRHGVQGAAIAGPGSSSI